MRLTGRLFDDELHRLFKQAMTALDSYEPFAWHIDPMTYRDFMAHPAFNFERRTLSGVRFEVHRVRVPTPMLAPVGPETAPYTDVFEEPQMLSLESRHRFSERPIFFNWDGNPEGYK